MLPAYFVIGFPICVAFFFVVLCLICQAQFEAPPDARGRDLLGARVAVIAARLGAPASGSTRVGARRPRQTHKRRRTLRRSASTATKLRGGPKAQVENVETRMRHAVVRGTTARALPRARAAPSARG